MNGTTVERSLRATVATAGATRLASRALEEVLDTNVFTPELWQALDDLHTCVNAAARAAAAFATARASDHHTWEAILSTLARINLHLWAADSATTLADELLLIDVLEDTIIDLLAARAPAWSADTPYVQASRLDVDPACVDELVVATHTVCGADSVLAVHVLVGVALRAMSERT